MDVESIGVVTAVWHADLNEAERWFVAIGQTFAVAESKDWAAFRLHLEQHALNAGIPAETVEGFVRYVEEHLLDPMSAIAELADPGNAAEVLRLYESELEQALLAAAEPAEVDHPRRLLWVTDAQMAELEKLTETRGDWTEWLCAQLDEWWPEWTNASPAELVSWLNECLPALAVAPAVDPRELAWVTAEQAAWLERASSGRGHWTEWLGRQLDEWWPEWAAAAPDQLAPWLDEWLPTLTPQDPFVARDLTWVTSEQAEELVAYAGSRGDWHDWLPLQLDQWWRDWPTADADTLTPWLTECLVALAEYDEPEPEDMAITGAQDIDPAGNSGTAPDLPSEPVDEPPIAPLSDEELEAERPDTEINAQVLVEGVLGAVVGEAALDLDEFSELSEEQFAELLSNVLEDEIDTRAPDTATEHVDSGAAG